MKFLKNSFFLVVLILTCLLVACEDEEDEGTYIEEKDLVIEELDFKTVEEERGIFKSIYKVKVFINTNKQTFVSYIEDVNFYRSNTDISTLDIKMKVNEKDDEGGDIEAEIYLGDSDVKEISEKFARLYLKTLEIE